MGNIKQAGGILQSPSERSETGQGNTACPEIVLANASRSSALQSAKAPVVIVVIIAFAGLKSARKKIQILAVSQ